MTQLSKIVNTIEPTDELIFLNKHYQRLETVYEKIEELIELMNNLDEPELTFMNAEIKTYAEKNKRLALNMSLKELNVMASSVAVESTLVAMKSREIFTFQKLGKAISIYKHIKEDKDPY